MGAYTTVVVGTDGSYSAEHAVNRAAALAADNDATLVLVSAYRAPRREDVEDASRALGGDTYRAVGPGPTEAMLERLAARLGDGVTCRIVVDVREADPVDALVFAARDHDAGAIVVGNAGYDTVSGRLLGSVPSGVSHRAPVDVLIVNTVRAARS